ncbi:hypothetical protein HS327_00753 [Glaesserella parasuis]|uniref:hypothetical protein n=1 Tax=Glaesserella parasuis TaxID=738 RepID=UPI0004DD7DC7|nr:hypothetical protein [Glaesserella parasuis]KEZ23148.1 hypothetical protein HS327_00753 [Glaesserella parasuis]
MEIKDFSAVQLAMCACSGIMALSVTTKDDPKSNSQLTFSLQAVKEVLDNLEKAQRDKNADMAYIMLYDAYHKALNTVNGNFAPELKN